MPKFMYTFHLLKFTFKQCHVIQPKRGSYSTDCILFSLVIFFIFFSDQHSRKKSNNCSWPKTSVKSNMKPIFVKTHNFQVSKVKTKMCSYFQTRKERIVCPAFALFEIYKCAFCGHNKKWEIYHCSKSNRFKALFSRYTRDFSSCKWLQCENTTTNTTHKQTKGGSG